MKTILFVLTLFAWNTANGRTPEEILRLVSQREDMKPWAAKSAGELQAWINRGVRFDCADDALVSKFYYTKLVLLAKHTPPKS